MSAHPQGQRRSVLVFGVTGQQGASVAGAMRASGWRVRALVRSGNAAATLPPDVDIVRGDLDDPASIRAAMDGVDAVYSMQPSSATDARVDDADEVRWGTSVADIAVERGVRHLLYSSSNGVGKGPTGIGQYEAKQAIEDHVRGLPIAATIVRPAGFMETLLMPGSGLDTGRFAFLVRPEQSVQLVAVEDIGKVVAKVFADPARFAGDALEIASDEVTGESLARDLGDAAGRPVAYARYSDAFLAKHPLLRQMVALLDAGPLAGDADFPLLRSLVPDLTGFRRWLETSGRGALQAALRGDPPPR